MFCIQDNQYFSPAVPGTREKLNEILDSPQVRWKIETIRAVRQPGAVRLWASNTDFQKFCLKEAAKSKGNAFKELTDEEKLERWANSLKESLPCLIFGARDFDEVPMKKNPEKRMKRRVLAGIHRDIRTDTARGISLGGGVCPCDIVGTGTATGLQGPCGDWQHC